MASELESIDKKTRNSTLAPTTGTARKSYAHARRTVSGNQRDDALYPDEKTGLSPGERQHGSDSTSGIFSRLGWR